MRRSFTLIELMLCASVIPTLLGFVGAAAFQRRPPLLHHRIQAQETNAIAALKSFAAAQAIFSKANFGQRAAENQYAPGATGKAETYANLRRPYAYPYSDLFHVSDGHGGPIALIAPPFAQASTPDKAWHGYIFLQGRVSGPNPNNFDLFATPAEYGVGGRNTFYINQTGIIKQADLGRGLTPDEAKQTDPMKDPNWIDS